MTQALLELAREYVKGWTPALGLEGWRIQTRLSKDIGNNIGLTTTHPEKKDALIELAEDWDEKAKQAVLEVADVEETVVHELLHVWDQELRAALETVLQNRLSPAEWETVGTMLRQLRERGIDSLATALVRATRAGVLTLTADYGRFHAGPCAPDCRDGAHVMSRSS